MKELATVRPTPFPTTKLGAQKGASISCLLHIGLPRCFNLEFPVWQSVSSRYFLFVLLTSLIWDHLYCCFVALVYQGPDLESSANLIQGRLFTTYPGKHHQPSEIPMAALAFRTPSSISHVSLNNCLQRALALSWKSVALGQTDLGRKFGQVT